MSDDEQNAVRFLWDALSDILENPETHIVKSERRAALAAIAEARRVFGEDLDP